MGARAAEMESLRRVVMVEWDPIGVYDAEPDESARASWRHEYDAYLPRIVALAERADQDALVAYLDEIRREWLGLDAAPQHDLSAARAMLAWAAGLPAADHPSRRVVSKRDQEDQPE